MFNRRKKELELMKMMAQGIIELQRKADSKLERTTSIKREPLQILEKPSKRTRSKGLNANTKWTAHHQKELQRLHDEGKSIRQLAKIFNRSESAVSQQIYKIKAKRLF